MAKDQLLYEILKGNFCGLMLSDIVTFINGMNEVEIKSAVVDYVLKRKRDGDYE